MRSSWQQLDFFGGLWYNITIIFMKGGSAMDIKGKIGDITDKVKNDKDFQKDLKKDPVKAVENLTGIDIPDDKMDKVVDAAKDKLGDVLGKIKK